MNSIGIYRISLPDGRCYIGQSVNVEKRWNAHRSDLRRGVNHSPYFVRAWDKYGEAAFSFEIVEPYGDSNQPIKEWLSVREQHWMDSLNACFNGRPAAESMLGFRHSSETRQRIAEAARGISDVTRVKMSLARKGVPRPTSMLQRMSDANRGSRNPAAVLTETDVLRIREIASNGSTQQSIADEYGVKRPTIGSIIQGRSWRHLL